MGGGKDLKAEKLGRKALAEAGSGRSTTSTGGLSDSEENKERNTSPLPRLLCRMRVREFTGASPRRGAGYGNSFIARMNLRGEGSHWRYFFAVGR